MTKFIMQFAADESGAVTVDWVVLCAAVVGLGIAVAATVTSQVDTAAQGLGANITAGITSVKP